MKKSEKFCKLFKHLGEELVDADEMFSTFEKYVWLLYGGYKTSNVSDLRHVLYKKSRNWIPSASTKSYVSP